MYTDDYRSMPKPAEIALLLCEDIYDLTEIYHTHGLKNQMDCPFRRRGPRTGESSCFTRHVPSEHANVRKNEKAA